jgi:hypothetical protein
MVLFIPNDELSKIKQLPASIRHRPMDGRIQSNQRVGKKRRALIVAAFRGFRMLAEMKQENDDFDPSSLGTSDGRLLEATQNKTKGDWKIRKWIGQVGAKWLQ